MHAFFKKKIKEENKIKIIKEKVHNITGTSTNNQDKCMDIY